MYITRQVTERGGDVTFDVFPSLKIDKEQVEI